MDVHDNFSRGTNIDLAGHYVCKDVRLEHPSMRHCCCIYRISNITRSKKQRVYYIGSRPFRRRTALDTWSHTHQKHM